MTTVRWLPIGHVSHGYRRVFLLEDERPTQRILVFTPMPYELVYHVKTSLNDERVTDPSLFWGLSLIRQGLADKSLLFGDDGFLSTRPNVLSDENRLSVDEFVRAAEQGFLTLLEAGN